MSKYFEIITEIIGWLQIVVSPLLVAIIIGSIIYLPNQTTANLIFAILICLAGLVAGIVFANKKFKSGKGTVWFLSRTMATPELDNNDETEIKK